MAKEYTVKILKRGEKRYVFDVNLGYRLDGTRNRTTISSKSVKEGRTKVAQLRLKLKLTASNSSPIFEDVYSLYIADCKNKKMAETTIYNKEVLYYEQLHVFYKSKLSKIKPADIILWQNQMNKTLAPSTANTRENNLSAFFEWCVVHSFLEVNPFKKVDKTSPVRKNELNFWTEEEFKTFIEYVTYPTHKLIFTTLFYTGLRKSELFGLKYSDIHGNELHLSETVKRTGSAYIIGDQFKNETSKRIVPIPRWLDFGTGDEYIFKPSLYSHINRDLDNWIKKAGIKRIRVHDFRHSYAAMLINKGVDIYTVSKMLGHKSITTTMDIYGHLYDEKRKEITDLFD